MATLSKTYGVTLVVNTSTIQYYGTDVNNYFGGSSDRIVMIKFDAPTELSSSEYMSDAILSAKIKADTYADADNITIGLISGSWPGNISGGYATLYGYCNGPTITHYLSTSTTETAKEFDVTDLLSAWAADPAAYSGLYCRCSTLSLARIAADNCAIETTVTERTAPGAPTSAFLSASVAENDPTLTWSGATQGTNNNIFGYEINYAESADGVPWGSWTYLKSVSTALMYGNTTVALPSTRGYYRKYRIKALGEWEIDSTWVDAGQVRKNSAPTAPTTVSAEPAIYESGGITIWRYGSTDPDTYVAKFEVQYAVSSDNVTWGIWYVLTNSGVGLSDTHAPSLSRGVYIKYRARAVDTFGIASSWVESNSVRRNSAPAAPTIDQPGTSKTIYNSKPRLLVTIGHETDGQMQTISSYGYFNSTPGSQNAAKRLVLRSASNVEPGPVIVNVVSIDTLGAISTAASKSFTYAASAFTDPVLQVGSTARKATHINQLRTAIDNVRDYYGLSNYSWAETITAGTTLLANWSGHVVELWNAINEIVTFVNGWDNTATQNKITLPAAIPISAGDKPRADVIEQLRTVIALL